MTTSQNWSAPAKRSHPEACSEPQRPSKRPALVLQDNATNHDHNAHGVSSLPSVIDHDAGEQSPSLTQAAIVIRQEFGTEILLKHNELRLIDIEIAKCQAALEQIRRAKLIPFPSQTGRSEDMLNVSTGSGPSLLLPGMQQSSLHSAPWGVVDGPYSQPYAGWLLRHPETDSGLSSLRGKPARGLASVERRMRPQLDEPVHLSSSRSRTQRGLAPSRLQALPLGYPQPKGSRGPLTLKRQSDGKHVKLVCQNCQRQDFSSVQGFINHCRISHQVHFATHEDAAQKAGTEDGVNQFTGEVSGSNSAAAPLQATSINQPVASSGASQAINSPSTGTGPRSELIHKFNRHDVNPRILFPAALVDPPTTPSSFARQREQRRRESNMGPPISPRFVPSPFTPNLSELFAKTGRAGDLEALVKEARIKEDIDGLVSPTTSDGFEASSPVLTSRHLPARHQRHGGLKAPSTSSRNSKTLGRKASATVSGNDAQSPTKEARTSLSPSDRSPSVLIDTNQAPSLVSDDGQSGSDGEDEEERPAAQLQHHHHRQQQQQQQHGDLPARISGYYAEDDLLPHGAPDGPSTMEVEAKIRHWKHRGGPRAANGNMHPDMDA